MPRPPASAAPAQQEFILSRLPASRAHRRAALVMVLVLLVAFVVVAGPLSTIKMRRVDAFVPMYAAAMFINDSITAILLLAQYSILRSRALLAISSGYLFTALMLVPWTLTFPGVFAPAGLLGAGLQSTAWVYLLWHGGFATFVIAYVLLKDDDAVARLRRTSPRSAILASVAATVFLVGLATILVTAGNRFLPRVMADAVHLSHRWNYGAASVALWSVAALVALWVRRRSVLDVYLMVVMCAVIIEITLISFPVPARFTVGWYSGRIFGVLSGSLVLFVLLYEITAMYAHLLLAVLAQRREREARLMTGDAVSASIAHELKQPLSAMLTNASAGLRWISRPTPELQEATEALQRIVAEGHRARDVIDGIRATFQKESASKALLDLNEVIWEALALLRDELQGHGVSVRAELSEFLPRVRGDHVQLQQVLVNLVTNAIESMATTTHGARSLCLSSSVDASGVTVAVADDGEGLDPAEYERIFDPLFTTKPHGMGMGLSICRSIIEGHEGRLWASANAPRGAVFRFSLPAIAGGPPMDATVHSA